MKILEVVPTWPTTTFLTRHMIQLSQQLPSIQVGVTTSPENSMLNSFDTSKTMDVVPLYFGTPLRRIQATLLGIMNYSSKPDLSLREKAILNLIEKNNPDIVHFHFNFLFDLHILPFKLGIPFTVSLRGPEIQMGAFTDKIYREKLCKILQRATAIHTVCDALGTKATEYCQTELPVFTVRTSVPIPAKPEKTVANTNSLISVARLYWKKGFHDLIRAMIYLPNVSLNIVGDGEEHHHLSYLIHSLNLQDRVHLLGELPYEEFELLMRRSTAYVQASMEEGFSNSLAEAMALGKPVFVTDVGGTAELIEEGKNGMFIPMGDPIGMAKKIEQHLFDTQLMQQLGLAARETAEREFSDEKHVQGFVEFYNYAYQNK